MSEGAFYAALGTVVFEQNPKLTLQSLIFRTETKQYR